MASKMSQVPQDQNEHRPIVRQRKVKDKFSFQNEKNGSQVSAAKPARRFSHAMQILHHYAMSCCQVRNIQGPVVQSTFSANPGLNLNLLFWFMHFCSTVQFKTLRNKSSINPESICGKTCSTS